MVEEKCFYIYDSIYDIDPASTVILSKTLHDQEHARSRALIAYCRCFHRYALQMIWEVLKYAAWSVFIPACKAYLSFLGLHCKSLQNSVMCRPPNNHNLLTDFNYCLEETYMKQIIFRAQEIKHCGLTPYWLVTSFLLQEKPLLRNEERIAKI